VAIVTKTSGAFEPERSIVVSPWFRESASADAEASVERQTCRERSTTIRLPGNLLAVPNRLCLVWWVVPGMMDSGIRGDVRRTYLPYVHGLEFPSSPALSTLLAAKVHSNRSDLYLPP
jgi:hypothetical protein